MSKYQALADRLAQHADDEWRVTFAELEALLGFSLPKGARSGPAWWANDDKGHSRAWTVQGWEVASVDRVAERVIFRRNAATADIEAASGVEPPAMKQAAEQASRDTRIRQAAPFMVAGVAVLAGLAAAVMRNVRGRRNA